MKEKTIGMMEAEHQELVTKFEEKMEAAMGLEESLRKLQDEVCIAHKEVKLLSRMFYSQIW